MNRGRETIFVYGTLRRGGSHHWRLAEAEFIDAGTVAGAIYRIDWYPGLVLGGGLVHGEVFAVESDLLAELDAFEGIAADEVAGSEYRRVAATVSTPQGDLTAWLWEWTGPVQDVRRISSGDWLAG